MKKFLQKILALGVLLAAASSSVQAVTVDFEDIASHGNPSRFVIKDKGLTFTGVNMDVLGNNVYGAFVRNETTWLATNHYFTTKITATNSDIFSLTKLDMALVFLFDTQAQEYATLVGHLENGDTVTTDILVSASAWQSFSLTGFTNVTSIDVFKRELGNGSLGFDNFEFDVQAVPEPATFSLLGLGLLGMTAYRRRSAKVGR
jgi:hypothetical protein